MRATVARYGVTVVALVIGTLGTAFAKPTAQQNCDKARVTAWRLYASCVQTKLAKDAGGGTFDWFAGFAKCRFTYLKKWAGFQPKASLAGSSCVGARFTDNTDGTVTDGLTGLVWEQKTDDDTLHDKDNLYTWSDTTYPGNGTAFIDFLAALNSIGLSGANDWRLPTLAELQTIELSFPCMGQGGAPACSCPSSPCVEAPIGPTKAGSYWSATSYLPVPEAAWQVSFDSGGVGVDAKANPGGSYVRAVRGGLGL